MTAAGPTRSFGPAAPGLLQEEALPEVNVSHRMYFEHFLKAFNGEEDVIVKPEQVRRVLCVMDAVRESARTGKAIEFEKYDKNTQIQQQGDLLLNCALRRHKNGSI